MSGWFSRQKLKVALRRLQKALQEGKATHESQRRILRDEILDYVPRHLHVELFDHEETQRAIGKRSCEWDETMTEGPTRTMTVTSLVVHFAATGESGPQHALFANLPFRFASDHPPRHIVRTINGLLVRERPDGGYVAGFLVNGAGLMEPQYAIRPRLARRLSEKFGEGKKPIYHLDGKTEIFTPATPS